MKREKLIRSKGYNLSKIQNELSRQLADYLDNNKITKDTFAKQLCVSEEFISQILDGDCDCKISNLVELCLAIGKAPVVSFDSL